MFLQLLQKCKVKKLTAVAGHRGRYPGAVTSRTGVRTSWGDSRIPSPDKRSAASLVGW